MTHLSPDFFMYFNGSDLILWNYRHHEQYRLNKEYVESLMNLAKGQSIDAKTLATFREANLLADKAEDPRWNWDILSRIFNHGTKNIPISSIPNATPEDWVDEYLEYCEEIGAAPEREEEAAVSLSLPKPNLNALKQSTLYEALKNRKTCRSFNGKACSIDIFTDILFTTFGYFHGSWNQEFAASNLETLASRKTSPSGGGLHCVDAYPFVWNVDGCESGIYRYVPESHGLIKKAPMVNEREFIELVWGQYYAKGMAFGTILAARLDQAAWKYKHSRAYRNVLLDVGHLSQTMQLAATSYGLNTWITGAFNDSGFEEILGLDPENETVFFFVGCGYADGPAMAFDDQMRERIHAYKPKGPA